MKTIIFIIFVCFLSHGFSYRKEKKVTMKYGFTELESAKKIKAVQISKLLKIKNPTVEKMYNHLGKPVLLQKAGLIGVGYMYLGHGDTVYLFQADIKQVNGIVLTKEDQLGKKPILSVFIFLDGHNMDEAMVVWEKMNHSTKPKEN